MVSGTDYAAEKRGWKGGNIYMCVCILYIEREIADRDPWEARGSISESERER